jgi:hypothetical protein
LKGKSGVRGEKGRRQKTGDRKQKLGVRRAGVGLRICAWSAYKEADCREKRTGLRITD